MTFDQIKERAEKFFEWPSDERKAVTYTSALLFAQYVANDAAECMKNLAIQQNDMETIGKHPDSLAVKSLDASTARIRALQTEPSEKLEPGVRNKLYDLIGICEAYQNDDGCECDVEECYQLSKDVIREANAILTAIPTDHIADASKMVPSPPNIGEGERVCEWNRPNGWEGMHDTGCGHMIDHEEAFSFCPYCGKPIVCNSTE